MNKIFLIALILALSACAHVETTQIYRSPPANLIASCEAIAQAEVKTVGDVITNYTDLIVSYKDCETRHKLLSDWAINDTK